MIIKLDLFNRLIEVSDRDGLYFYVCNLNDWHYARRQLLNA